MNLEKLAALVTVIGLPLLIASVGFAYVLDGRTNEQLSELKSVAESQNNIALNTMIFNDPTNIGIINAIENERPILISDGGSYTTAQLDKYLGDFDTVDFAYHEGLLSDDELCDSFSTYVQETESDTEVDRYLRQESAYFVGLPTLLGIVNSSTDSYCQQK